MNNPHVENEASTGADAPRQASVAGTGQQAIAGPFGLRDIVVGSAVLVMLVGSVLPFTIGSGLNLWTAFSLFYVGIGIIMPLLAAGLFLARRLSPEVRLRVGSLSVDQFASVTAVLAVCFFFLQLVYVFSVGALLGFIGSAVLVAATTFAPHIPFFAEEFRGRREVPAHPMARDAQPLHRAPKPAPQTQGPASGAPNAGMFSPNAPGTGAAGAAGAGVGAAGAGQARPDARGQERTGFDARQGTEAAHAGPGHAGTGQAGSGQPGSAQAPAGGNPAGANPAGGNPAGTGANPAAQAGKGTAQAGTGAAQSAEAGAGAGAGAAGATRTGTGAGAGTATGAAASGAGAGTATGAAAAAPDASSRQPAGRSAEGGDSSLPATTVNPAVEPAAPSSASQPATQAQESISATRDENENVVEAFWFAVGTPRQIVDERTGLPLFMFYPGDWELGLEDRGHEFLVQDKRTGRIGVLRDLTNIERVSDENSGH